MLARNVFGRRYRIRERIGHSGSFGLAVDLLYLEIQDRDNGIKALFGYKGAGGGLSVRLPVGANSQSEWEYLDTVDPIHLGDFAGPATLLSAGASLYFGFNYHRWVFYGRLPIVLGVSFAGFKGLALGFQTTSGSLRLVGTGSA